MDWKRGKTTDNNEEEKPIDLKRIKYRISYVVDNELKEFKPHIKLEEKNKFGKWVVK
jgi:hypothetical protein